MSELDAKGPATLGKNTSEYAASQSAGWMAKIGMILGALVAAGPLVVNSGGSNTTSTIVGAIVAISSVLLQTLTTLGYVKSRTDIKVAATLGKGQ